MARSALKSPRKRSSTQQSVSEETAMSAATQPDEKRGWGVERKIRIEFIVATMLSVAGYVWYAGKIDTKVEYQEDRLSKLERIADALVTDRNTMLVRITKIEGKQEQAVAILERVERTLSELNRKAK